MGMKALVYMLKFKNCFRTRTRLLLDVVDGGTGGFHLLEYFENIQK